MAQRLDIGPNASMKDRPGPGRCRVDSVLDTPMQNRNSGKTRSATENPFHSGWRSQPGWPGLMPSLFTASIAATASPRVTSRESSRVGFVPARGRFAPDDGTDVGADDGGCGAGTRPR